MKKQEKAVIKNDALKSWIALNEFLRDCTLTQAQKLLDEEKKGRVRKQFIKRIHSRLNRLRAKSEREAIEKAES